MQLGVELVTGLGLGRRERQRTRSGARTSASPASPAVQRLVGTLVLGLALGTAFSLLVPRPIVPGLPFTGASVVLAPVFGYFMMRHLGRWYLARGETPSGLATGAGGAAFAFGFAAARVMLLLWGGARAA